jgi:hypothetical protein
MPWEPFNDHDIRFFVEKVTYWDAGGNLCETNNTATAPADVSAWATFPTNPVTTDANGRVTEFLTIVTNANLFSVTLAAYDTSVYRKAATPPPAPFSMLSLLGGAGTPKTLAAPVAPPDDRTIWDSLLKGDSAYKVKFSKAPEEDESGNQYGYDDMDTPNDPTDDHVSVADDGFTFVWVTVVSPDGADGSAFTFTANPPAYVDIGPLPTPAPATGFLLKIIGKQLPKIYKWETTIEVRKKGETAICGTIKVNGYTKKTTVDWIIYRVTDPNSSGTKPLNAIDGDQTKTFANKILKQAVMAVGDVKVEDRDNVVYDQNYNGCLEWYMDGNPVQPEFDILKTAIGVHEVDNYKSVVVKKVNFAWRLSAAAPQGQKKITLKGVGSNKALIEYFKSNPTMYAFVELRAGLHSEPKEIYSIGQPKSDNTVDVTFTTDLEHSYAANKDEMIATWGAGTADANPAIVSDHQDAEEVYKRLVHEALHRPNMGDLFDVKNLKNVMSNGDAKTGSTELRFNKQFSAYQNLPYPQNQWDKIPRP